MAVRLSDGSRNQRAGTGITAVAIPPEGVLVGEKDVVHRLSEINCIKKMQGGGGYKYALPPCILGKSDENSRKIVTNKAVSTIDKNKELG